MTALPLIEVPALDRYGVAIRLTTRAGGVSQGGYTSANLATHVGDDPHAVAENRRRLALALGAEPLWLNQVHGTAIWDADRNTYVTYPTAAGEKAAATFLPLLAATTRELPTADGAVTATAGRWLALLTADCLPVVLVATSGQRLGVAHAGWRGLAAGILRAAVAAVGSPFAAWIGPAICGRCYEVDPGVVAALAQQAALPTGSVTASYRRPGHFLVDLPTIAAAWLYQWGAEAVIHSGACTQEDPDSWYSHRQAGPKTGRFATLAALRPR